MVSRRNGRIQEPSALGAVHSKAVSFANAPWPISAALGTLATRVADLDQCQKTTSLLLARFLFRLTFTVEAVAERMNVSPATLYRYFPGGRQGL